MNNNLYQKIKAGKKIISLILAGGFVVFVVFCYFQEKRPDDLAGQALPIVADEPDGRPKYSEDANNVDGQTNTDSQTNADGQTHEMSDEDWQRYYSVYKTPSVLHLRKALNGYLNGTNEGIEATEAVLKPGEGNSLSGLDSFDKAYYESKFIVYDLSGSIAGGDQITIIFQDKPDKLFQAWVYWNEENPGYYDLRGFWQVPDSEIFLQELLKDPLTKIFMQDKEHAI